MNSPIKDDTRAKPNHSRGMPFLRKTAAVSTVFFASAGLLGAAATAQAADPEFAKASSSNSSSASATKSKKKSKNSVKNPFSEGTWHAVQGTWPGTLKFDDAERTGVLTPVGAAPLVVKYDYTVEPTQKSGANGKPATSVQGTLTMENDQKQVVKAAYVIEEGKHLTLTYTEGQLPEYYVRMSPAEEQAEMEKLNALIRSGKTKPFTLDPKKLNELSVE